MMCRNGPGCWPLGFMPKPFARAPVYRSHADYGGEGGQEQRLRSPADPQASARCSRYRGFGLSVRSGLGAIDDRFAAARRARYAADYDRLSTEGTDDPAADAPASARDPLGRFRQGRVHAERSVLCPLALGAHPDGGGCRHVQARGARACEPDPFPVLAGHPPRSTARRARRGESVLRQFPRVFPAARAPAANGPTAPWATRCGPACASRTCWTGQG